MKLEHIKQICGRGVYVPGDDIDTDQIIPARFLMCVTFDALGGQLFYDARQQGNVGGRLHPLSDERFKDAKVLLVGANFGCGSSREHAPQSIRRAGFRAIIGIDNFSEIFFGNSTALGIPCVSLTRAAVAEMGQLVERDPNADITVDLENLEVRAGGKTYNAQIKPIARDALIRGEWDPLPQLLEDKAAVEKKTRELQYLTW